MSFKGREDDVKGVAAAAAAAAAGDMIAGEGRNTWWKYCRIIILGRNAS